MKTCFILRGLPGCGKSTLAEFLSEKHNAVNCCADNFMVDNKGKYKFEHNRLAYCHGECMSMFIGSLSNGRNVIVSNTATTEKEFDKYKILAENDGYTVFVLTVENYHNGTSVHSVPIHAMNRMEDRYEIKLR